MGKHEGRAAVAEVIEEIQARGGEDRGGLADGAASGAQFDFRKLALHELDGEAGGVVSNRGVGRAAVIGDG